MFFPAALISFYRESLGVRGLLGKLVLQRTSAEKEPNTQRRAGDIMPFGSKGEHVSLFSPIHFSPKKCVGQGHWDVTLVSSLHLGQGFGTLSTLQASTQRLSSLTGGLGSLPVLLDLLLFIPL